MLSHKRNSKKHFGSSKKSSKRSKIKSHNSGEDTSYSSDVSSNKVSSCSSSRLHLNPNASTLRCPICHASVTSSLERHYSKHPNCAIISGGDSTILTTKQQICSSKKKTTYGSTALNNSKAQSLVVPTNVNLEHFSTDDVDEGIFFVPDENEDISKNCQVDTPFIPPSLRRNYDVRSLEDILLNTSTSSMNSSLDLASPFLHRTTDIQDLQATMSDDIDIDTNITTAKEDQIIDLHNLQKKFDEGNTHVLLYQDAYKNNSDNSISTHTERDQPIDQSIDTSHPELFDNFCAIQGIIAKANNDLRLTASEVASIRLLKLMIDGNIAASRYSDITQWFTQTFMTFIGLSNSFVGSNFQLPSTKKNVVKLCYDNIFHNSNKYSVRPIHSFLQLPSKNFCRISSFDFKSMVLSMLIDTDLVHPSNMLVEKDEYLDPSIILTKDEKNRVYGDIHTGSWFYIAHSNLCKSTNDILCPIILFIDGTPIDSYGNLKLESVMFTLGIFNRETRNKSSAWRLLGYIPDSIQDYLSGINNDVNMDNDDTQTLSDQVQKRKDYHHSLKHIIQGIIDAENSNGIIWRYVDSQNNVRTYCLKFALMYIIGDALGNDKLCDRFLSYGPKTKFLCRDCNIPTSQIDNIGYPCQFIKRKDLRSKSASELKDICYYKISNNAFDYCKFGNDMYGINGCTPVEYLHQFLLGVMKKTLEIFFDSITSNGFKILDQVGRYIAINWHRQSNKDYPDLQPFKEGIQKKKLSGNEVIAQAFIIYLSMAQTYTMTALVAAEKDSPQRYKTRKFSSRSSTTSSRNGSTGSSDVITEKLYYAKVGSSLGTVKKWIRMFEASISFYAWMKQPEIPFLDLKLDNSTPSSAQSNKTSKADIAIRSYMKLYKDVVIKSAGGNSGIRMKDHQTEHIPHQVRRFASTLNFDGGIGERHLKNMTKNPARSTQQRASLLAQQATERYAERVSVNHIHNILVAKGILEPLKSNVPYVSEASKNGSINMENGIGNAHVDSVLDSNDCYFTLGGYQYHFDSNGKFQKASWDTRKHRKITHDVTFVEEVYKRLQMSDYQIDCNHLDCFTVLKVNAEGKHTSFRADPYFFKKVWFDWCMTKWETDDDSGNTSNDTDSSSGLYPARILMFIDPSNMNFKTNVIRNKGKYWAVIKCTTDDKRRRSSESTLYKRYERENNIRIISCRNISRDAFVCSDIVAVGVNNSIGKPDYNVSHVMSLKPIDMWSRVFIDTKWA